MMIRVSINSDPILWQIGLENALFTKNILTIKCSGVLL